MADLGGQSDRELFDECLRLTAEDDDSQRWEIIGELSVHRATRSIFDRALALGASGRPGEACVGIDVLNDFGPKANFPWRDETVEVLVNALKSGDSSVVRSALAALGKFGPATATADVIAYATSEDDAIRLTVAMALPRFIRELLSDEAQSALRALTLLTQDKDGVIRDWSTFGLGNQTDVDSTEIRSALLSRLDDTDANTRHEALVALARRHDRRVIPALIRALEADEVAYLAIEAAELVRAPEVAPALRQLAQDPNWTNEELDVAIRRCDVDAQEDLVRQLDTFMRFAEAACVGLTCFSDRVPVDSGGPQIGYSDEQRYLTWSFEELLDRANGSPEAAAQLVLKDISG
jgi:hypothetical protein